MDNQDLILVKLDSQLFDVFWTLFKDKINLNYDFIKDIFIKVDINYKKFLSESDEKTILLKSLSIYQIALYTCEEHYYNTSNLSQEEIIELEKKPQYISLLVKMIFDKLIYNDFDNIQNTKINTKYSVEVSTLNMFLNRILNLLFTIPHDNIKMKLLYDIFTKCMMLIKSSLSQLSNGLETEAMASWRTLHELECVLKIIYDSDEEVSKAYFRHLEYGSYHRGEVFDPEHIFNIEANMNKDMEILKVKKSNKEKFINYGWLHWAKKIHNDEEIKFNFLGGLQKLANLSGYKKWYEFASDVTHSTPLLVYANEIFLYDSTLKILYESFFRIETLFSNYAINILGKNNSRLIDYLKFRNTYKEKVELIYQQISTRNKTNKDYLK